MKAVHKVGEDNKLRIDLRHLGDNILMKIEASKELRKPITIKMCLADVRVYMTFEQLTAFAKKVLGK